MTNLLIITGGSRGIGEKTIAYFVEQGWQAINISRTPCKLKGVTNFNIDLSDLKQLEHHAQALQSAVKNAKTISLVHNAGYYQRDSVAHIPLDNLRKMLEVNVIASVALNNLFIPLMPKTSSIIYIGTTLAEKAVPNSASYTLSKHAVIGLMRATCQDLIGKDIHTACICPGLVDTQLLKDTMSQEMIQQFIAKKIIGGRLIEPIEIAKTIYFCAISPVINGTVMHANLGQVAD